MKMIRKNYMLALSLLASLAAGGCGGAAPTPFSLQFAATVNGDAVSCGKEYTGLGPTKQHTIGINDLRFYVSNVQFRDGSGNPVALTLDDNEFQLNQPAGSVALIDLTSNTEGNCAAGAIAYSEGTARTNSVLRGTTVVQDVASVSLDIGVPQAVMKSVIGANTAEGAPSPMAEMYWSWASGYRHIVLNFTARDTMNKTGEGYLHIGSRNCGPQDGRALQDRESCEFVNTPKFSAEKFNLSTDKVTLDLGVLLDGLDFMAPIYDSKTFEVIGQGVGAECHSSPTQTDCSSVFPSLGIDVATGTSQAAANRAFKQR